MPTNNSINYNVRNMDTTRQRLRVNYILYWNPKRTIPEIKKLNSHIVSKIHFTRDLVTKLCDLSCLHDSGGWWVGGWGRGENHDGLLIRCCLGR